LHDDQLKIFSGISTEKEFKDKETIFLQQEDSKIFTILPKVISKYTSF